MLAGHFTTALIAKQRVPASGLLFLLIASQLPDLLWVLFHFLGLEPTTPTDVLDTTLSNLMVDMVFSHSLLPVLGWTLLVYVVGIRLYRQRAVGIAAAVLVLVHAATDYVAGYPHHVLGPETPAVATGLYYTAPYLAVLFEIVFTAVTLPIFIILERARGVIRSRGSIAAICGVFVFNIIFMLTIATIPLRERFGIPAMDLPFNTNMPSLAVTYWGMLFVLWWLAKQPEKTAS